MRLNRGNDKCVELELRQFISGAENKGDSRMLCHGVGLFLLLDFVLGDDGVSDGGGGGGGVDGIEVFVDGVGESNGVCHGDGDGVVDKDGDGGGGGDSGVGDVHGCTARHVRHVT